MKKTAFYPGSFDPITNGHLDIIDRAIDLFDKLVVGIGINLAKKPLFPLKDRLEMVRESVGNHPNISITSYTGLTADYAVKIGAVAIIRGLRAISDFEYEFQMALANHKLSPEVETVFLMPSLPNVYLNSTMVKTIARLNGEVENFVPQNVAERLKKRFSDIQGR